VCFAIREILFVRFEQEKEMDTQLVWTIEKREVSLLESKHDLSIAHSDV
jgi:hypothetical protein